MNVMFHRSKVKQSQDIPILWPWELPQRISGTVVVCDVYAATSNIASFLARGARKLLIVNEGSVESVKNAHPGALVIGESRELPADFFDYSNDPYDNSRADVSGRVVIYMSDNGTRVIEQAFRVGADRVVTVSFVNIDSVVSWARNLDGDLILLPSGAINFDEPAAEDGLCAEVTRDLVFGAAVDWQGTIQKATSSILAHYKPHHKRQKKFEEELRVIFDRNAYPVVPQCHWEREGLIRVSAAGG